MKNSYSQIVKSMAKNKTSFHLRCKTLIWQHVEKLYSTVSTLSSQKSNGIKDFSCIPGPWPSLPFVGTGWQYFKYIGRYDLQQLHKSNEDKYRRFGPIVKEEYQWRKPIIHIFDPADFEEVFRNQGKCPIRPPNEFVRHYRMQKKNREKYPNVGLAHMLGDEWYKQRMILAPALMKLKSVQNHIPSQNEICDDFVDHLLQTRDPESHVLHNLQDSTYRLALESICMMSLDSRMQCLSTNNTTNDGTLLISATKKLFESYNDLYYGLPLWKLFPTNSYRKLDEAESSIYRIASKYVQIGIEKMKNSDAKKKASHGESVLETLLNTEGLTENDVKITIIDFIAGGIFTVSNTLSLLLYHLAKNVEAQEKLYNEIQSVMGDESLVTHEVLSKLPYLKACVKECFRLSSPVPGIMRILPQPVTLSGYRVPAGTIIFSHFMVSCRLSQHFNDPLKFHPERWLGDARKQSHSFILLPFGHGNRMCAGRRFSELELHVATIKVIRKFHLEALNPQVDFTHAFIIIPSHPISLKLTLRRKH